MTMAHTRPERGTESGRWEGGRSGDFGGSRPGREEMFGFEEEVARVPTESLNPVMATVLASSSVVAEEFRVLRSRVRAVGEERPFRCVGILSGASGEGKTTVSIGLALAMAHEPGCRVLVIEADLRRPSLDARLELPRADGLGEWLESKSATIPVRRVMPYGFSLLSAGRSSWERPEMLGSTRMARLLEAARQSFDFIVVDCPPLAPVADSVMLQDMVDGFLLVVRARHSPSEVILRALSRLKEDRIQGVVFNAHKSVLPKYYNDSYGYASGR